MLIEVEEFENVGGGMYLMMLICMICCKGGGLLKFFRVLSLNGVEIFVFNEVMFCVCFVEFVEDDFWVNEVMESMYKMNLF